MYKINKSESGEYITGICENSSEGTIGRTEYLQILEKIRNRPEDGKRLRADTISYEREQKEAQPDDIISAGEILAAIFGGNSDITRRELSAHISLINKYHQITEVVKGFDGTFTLSKLKKLINEIKEIIENGN